MIKIIIASAQVVATFTLGYLPRASRTQRFIFDNEVFMFDYYGLQLYPIVRLFLRTKRTLIRHYVVIGARSGKNPHHLFETNWYLRKNNDVATRRANPLEHYLRHGSREGRLPSPLLDVAWYYAQMGVPNTTMNPLMLYRLAKVAGSRQSPTPFFDPQWYLKSSPDLDRNGDLFEHFVSYGRHEKRSPNRYLDVGWYLARYQDAAQAGYGAANHFILFGSDEDRDPSVLFSTAYYRARCLERHLTPPVPLIHYLSAGRKEGIQAYDANKLPADVRIAVIIHLYYKDLWPEIARYLGSLPKPFDLFISVPKSAPALAAFMRRRYPKAVILEVENLGHDIAPFFQFLSMIFETGKLYSAICKIHTKKGTTHPALWRRLMLQSTLRNKYLVSGIVRSFVADENLCIAGAADLYISGWEFIGSNGRQIAEMCIDLYGHRAFPPHWGFFAGSMFWIKPDILQKLASRVARKRASFAENVLDNDGQYSHALERMLGYLATLENKNVALVRSYGAGPHDFDIDCVEAARATTEQPHMMLDRLAREYPALAHAEGGPSERRVWQPGRDARLGVHFVGPITYVNGLATSARNYLSTINDLPIEVSAERWAWGFDRLEQCAYDHPPKSDQPIHIIHLNLDLLYSLSVNDPPLFAALFANDRYFVLICYFELVSLLPEWIPVLRKFDEVWCASEFMMRAINAVSRIKTRLVRPPMKLAFGDAPAVLRSRRHFGLDEDRFVFAYFLDAGSVVGRKNPEAFLKAYCDEFDPADGVCCFLKIHYGNPNALLSDDMRRRIFDRPDIVISDKIFPASELPSLFESIDCYVSPHRSEGLGLTIIEAMNAGKPTIATPYGGAADFVTDETAFKIDYRWTEVGDGNSPYPANFLWADPDVGSLASVMRSVVSDKELARAKGDAGRQFIREIFGRERTASGVRDALHDIWRAAGFERSAARVEQAQQDGRS